MREAADRIANMNTHILALQKEIENLHMDMRSGRISRALRKKVMCPIPSGEPQRAW